jgi:hypothetical protein
MNADGLPYIFSAIALDQNKNLILSINNIIHPSLSSYCDKEYKEIASSIDPKTVSYLHGAV